MESTLRMLVPLMLLLLSQITQADPEAEVKYRQAVMKAVGGHMASMAAILKGKTHLSELSVHADGMAALAKVVPGVFPEGSGNVGHTEALPVIWTDPQAFKTAMDKYVEAADGMQKAAASGEMSQVGPAINALGQSCKGCHDDFREEHDH
ncbi:MAG: cytochrome c [Gammaproteobacteria bacterium]|nr:cytochrome c [Gammaproteobacteria bacterium]